MCRGRSALQGLEIEARALATIHAKYGNRDAELWSGLAYAECVPPSPICISRARPGYRYHIMLKKLNWGESRLQFFHKNFHRFGKCLTDLKNVQQTSQILKTFSKPRPPTKKFLEKFSPHLEIINPRFPNYSV